MHVQVHDNINILNEIKFKFANTAKDRTGQKYFRMAVIENTVEDYFEMISNGFKHWRNVTDIVVRRCVNAHELWVYSPNDKKIFVYTRVQA